MQSVITDSVKTFWQNMLCHASYEFQYREGFVFNLSCFVITIPIADGLSVISFNSANRDGRGDDILCQILRQPLSTWAAHLPAQGKRQNPLDNLSMPDQYPFQRQDRRHFL